MVAFTVVIHQLELFENPLPKHPGSVNGLESLSLAEPGGKPLYPIPFGPRGAASERRNPVLQRRCTTPFGKRSETAFLLMTDEELRQAIRRMALPNSLQAANRARPVVRLAKAREAALAYERAAWWNVEQARRDDAEWCEKHPVRAWMRDRWGICGRATARRRKEADICAKGAKLRRVAVERAWRATMDATRRHIAVAQRLPTAWLRAMCLELQLREAAGNGQAIPAATGQAWAVFD